MFKLAIGVLIMLMGSALCSGAEAALLSISPLQAKQMAQSNRTGAVALANIREHINRPIATIVILNNLFNIVGSIVIGSIATDVLGDAWLGVFSGVITFCIIIFAEILPKTLAEQHAEQVGLLVALPVQSLTWVMQPVIWLLEKLTNPFTQGNRQPTTDETQIKMLTHIGHQEGLIEADEAEMIRRVFWMNDVTAADIMTPRVAVTHLNSDRTLDQLRDDIIHSQHTRILVTQETIDQVIGTALKHELLAALVEGQGEREISTFTRPVQVIPETEPTDKLLKTFQASREHLMVVVDEYGGLSGVVTLEDVLEVLTGEIVDETDQVVDLQAWARQRYKRLLQPT